MFVLVDLNFLDVGIISQFDEVLGFRGVLGNPGLGEPRLFPILMKLLIPALL